MPYRARVASFFLLSLLFAACAAPPSKEMDQAQGAIDAAKAAGADVYAAAEFNAAVDALRRSEQAVNERDYRQALSLAIDSREHAQNAAKLAVSARARARGDVERAIAEASTLLTQARERLREADSSRVPRRVLTQPRAAIDRAAKSLQEARTALNADDYPTAARASDGVAKQIQAALAEIERAIDGQRGRRR